MEKRNALARISSSSPKNECATVYHVRQHSIPPRSRFRYNPQEPTVVTAPQFLDEHAVRARLRMPDLIKAMEHALIEMHEPRGIRFRVRLVLAVGALWRKRSSNGAMWSCRRM